MKVVTSKQMHDIDRRTIEEIGLPSMVLMERAGLAVARHAVERYAPRRVLVIAGTGNNGGDGLVAARELHNHGVGVTVLIWGTKDRMTEACMAQFKIAQHMSLPMSFRTALEPRDLHHALVIDAAFGTGLKKDIEGERARSIATINQSDLPVLSVDIPSGVSADTGQVMGEAIRAQLTVTFGALKRGHLLHPGAGHSGEVIVEDIGFPQKLFHNIECTAVGRDTLRALLPARQPYSHKGSYGHVFLAAGSRGKSGAAIMAARASLRAGAGLVTIGAPASMAQSFEGRVTEEMVMPLPDEQGSLCQAAFEPMEEFMSEWASVLAFGPGIGRAAQTVSLVHAIVKHSAIPMVIDADAINALAEKPDILKRAKAPIVITPHPGEFARLCGVPVREVEADRLSVALEFAKKYSVVLLLKGVPTIVATPKGHAFINTTGNAGMATAGSGDVLTGIVAGLLAQGLGPAEAASAAACLHGMAGDIAANTKGTHGLMATDITEALPAAFMSLKEAL